MPRFVIQEHTTQEQTHWDFMLQQQDHLATWQIPTPPNTWHETTIKCNRIFNHRLKYLTFEGPISNNRGNVKIVDKGEYILQHADENIWQVQLLGDNIVGNIELVKINDKSWQMKLRSS